ncbi:MAG: hypothetical protein QOE23_1690 [Pseudonocardiales bacterium]|nr:hypothetical protein [Pseudonocardiales bacterium]
MMSLGPPTSSANGDPPNGDSRAEPSPLRTRAGALLAMATTLVALTACSTGERKSYDIAPIFPLTAGKCAKYDGKSEGTGFASHCWVTKANCQQAAADWRQMMREGGVTDAILFRC